MIPSIDAAAFEQPCLALLDHLGPEGLIVTKHGKPVARVLPIPRTPADLIGSLADKTEIKGDLLSTGLTWDADAEP